MGVHVARNLFDCELRVMRKGQLWQQLCYLRANQMRAKDFAGVGVGDELGPTAALV
jgi:hypothetical protein